MRSLNHFQKRFDRSQNTTEVIRTIDKLWYKALQRTISLSRIRSSRKVPCTNQHSVLQPFYTAPSECAANLSFGIHPSNECVNTRQTLRDATASNSTDPLLGYPQIAIPPDEWQHENLQRRRSKIPLLRFIANKSLRMTSGS